MNNDTPEGIHGLKLRQDKLHQDFTYHRHCPVCGAMLETIARCNDCGGETLVCPTVFCCSRMFTIGVQTQGKLEEGVHAHDQMV